MNSYIAGIFIITGVNLIAIMGVSLLTGFTGLFSFGHGGFMAIGAYVSALTIKMLHVPFPVGLMLGTAAAALIGIFIGYPSLRLKGDYFVIATLGFGEAVRLIIENLPSITGGARGLPDVSPGTNLTLVVILDILIFIMIRNFLSGRHGRNCIAIREEELAAQTVGIDVTRYKVTAMAMSSALAGLSGALLGHFMHYLHPSMFGMAKSNELIITVILGGQGSITGTVLATLLLIPLPEVLRAAQEWRYVMYGFVVILVILVRPGGLMGYKELSLKGIIQLFKSIPDYRRTRGENNGARQ